MECVHVCVSVCACVCVGVCLLCLYVSDCGRLTLRDA